MNIKGTVEMGVNMNNRSMCIASKDGRWHDVEQYMRVNDSLILAYERLIGAERR